MEVKGRVRDRAPDEGWSVMDALEFGDTEDPQRRLRVSWR